MAQIPVVTSGQVRPPGCEGTAMVDAEVAAMELPRGPKQGVPTPCLRQASPLYASLLDEPETRGIRIPPLAPDCT